MRYLKRLIDSFAGYFSTKQFSERENSPDGIMVKNRLIYNNFHRMMPLAFISALFQVVFFISDICTGFYKSGNEYIAWNITGEIVLFVSGLSLFIVSAALSSRIKEDYGAMHTLYTIYYITLEIGLFAYIVSDFLNGFSSTSMFYLSIVFMFVPIFSAKESSIYYISSLTLIIACVIFNALNGVVMKEGASNVQVIAVFLSSGLMAAYMRVSTMRIMYNDIDLNRLNKQLEVLSEIDPLTKIANRRAYESYFSEIIGDVTDKKTNIAIAMCDVDHFKNFNDTYSHVRGDEALISISHVFRSKAERLGDNGFTARVGGEEFIFVYTGWENEEEMISIFSDIRASVEKLCIESGDGAAHPFVTVSIGVAASTEDTGVKNPDYYEISDKQVYVSKRNGRNLVSFRGKSFK